MQHVVTSPRPPFSAAGGRLTVHQIPAWQDNLIWLIVCNETGEVAAVDGPEAGPVLAYIEANGLTLTAIFNTHTHGDHIGINRDLQERGLLEGLRVVGSAARAAEIPGITEPVGEGDVVRLGGFEGRVMLTEGHINGHISFVFGDALFCGDTLFAGGCGYLFDGPPAKMHDSLRRLAALDGATRVCCAHEYTEDNLKFAWSVEPDNDALVARMREVWALRARGGCSVPSTVAEERATNPFLRTDSPTLHESVAAAMPEADLSSPVAIFAATRALKDRKDHRSIPDAALPV
jgi:hydroxyacylglutathione hydrolase